MDKAYQIKGLLFRSDAGAFTINSSTGDALTNRRHRYYQSISEHADGERPDALSASQTWSAIPAIS